jgi:hypothetical protein
MEDDDRPNVPISADHLVRQIEQQSIAATATMKARPGAFSKPGQTR